MRGGTLIAQHPPTPPNTGIEYKPDLRQIAQYNMDRTCSIGEEGRGSIRLAAHEVMPVCWSEAGSHIKKEVGLGVHYDNCGPSTGYYQDEDYQGVSNNPGICSPLTPRSTVDDDYVRRATRNERPLAPSNSPRKVEQSPRPKAVPRAKKPKAEKGEKSKTPKLTAPLSILTKDLNDILIKNMEEWVNRPIEARRKEVEKRNGYITRPMNSFMLYRSAYAERAKAWCLQNNHQIVSSVAGESWPLEPPEIRNLYNDYAKTERVNHQNAHPTYKFSPSKTPASVRKRKNECSDGEELSDFEDAEWAPSRGPSRSRQARRLDRSPSHPKSGMRVEYFDHPSFLPSCNAINRSPWEMTNDGRSLLNHYYQTANYPAMTVGPNFADEIHMRRVGTPASSSQFQTNHALLGLPGGSAGSVMNQLHPQAGMPFNGGPLDPMLLVCENNAYPVAELAALPPHDFRNGRSGTVDEELNSCSLESLLELQPQQYEYYVGSWPPDQTITPQEQDLEFEKWMGEH